jgi:hypothetical protein
MSKFGLWKQYLFVAVIMTLTSIVISVVDIITTCFWMSEGDLEYLAILCLFNYVSHLLINIFCQEYITRLQLGTVPSIVLG